MGNRSVGNAPPGVPRILVRMPGFLVSAQICIPRSHPFALWVLPWVEGLLMGQRLPELLRCPPWPSPPDPLVGATLCRTLFDLRWALPDWRTGEPVVDRSLAGAFAECGRLGLAERMFDADVIDGQWWAEGVEGNALPRQTAAQFDWDGRWRADTIVPTRVPPRTLLAQARFNLLDLLRKLGGVSSLEGRFDRAFLATPLMAGEPKAILFEAYGTERRLIPEELGELVPVLERHCPDLLGARARASSRVVQLPPSPVEAIDAAMELLTSPSTLLGPAILFKEQADRFACLVESQQGQLASWLEESTRCQPVIGPTQRHFDALREMCRSLEGTVAPHVLITSAFLNSRTLDDRDGLADVLAAAPADTRVSILYGHASDDLPDQQSRDMAEWLSALVNVAPTLAGRVDVLAGEKRSHEKIAITSRGEWMVGSWNACSSRPNATVFECSLRGNDPRLASKLLTRIAQNIATSRRERVVEALANRVPNARVFSPDNAIKRVRDLMRAASTLQRCAAIDGTRDSAWRRARDLALQASSMALHWFRTAIHLDIVDEQQTRDAMLSLVHSARRDVLIASDRLSEGALDPATLRTLARDEKAAVVLRLVWGREWAGRRVTDELTHSQLSRARDTIASAREHLGESLCSSDEPMENHAKVLVIDGLRGLVTSENLLAYGGEKSKYESRELGLLFWSPVVARHMLGRALHEWPAELRNARRGDDCALAWAVAGNEAWHSLHPLRERLDFEWRSIAFIESVVRDATEHGSDDISGAQAYAGAWRDLGERSAGDLFEWVQGEAQRVGLVLPEASSAWRPYDAEGELSTDMALEEAQLAVEELRTSEVAAGANPVQRGTGRVVHALIEAVERELVRIPAGVFTMGDDRVPIERPRHRVRITHPFWLGRTPVTQRLWEAVMGRLPHLRDVERNPEFPIIQVTRADMLRFIDRLNDLPGGGGFSLPTEAQWEYACRAGASTIYCFGDDPGRGDKPGMLEQYAWTKRNSNARLQTVGQLRANAFGLHDMHGLVYETMRDGFRPYTAADATDPIGPLNGERTGARGGFWGRFPIDPRNAAQEHFRCAARQHYEQSHRVSFRLARESKDSE